MCRTNVVLQILHSACGCAYGDKECLRERSEESGEEGLDSGPRTSQIRILLKDKLLQKSVVRGPLRKVGTANKIILHCIVSQWITKS